MDTTLVTLAIAVIGVVLSICSFAIGRKDKAVKEGQESSANQRLLEYRLNELDKKVTQILDKLEKYDEEIENKVEKAISSHVNQYHKSSGTKRNGVNK